MKSLTTIAVVTFATAFAAQPRESPAVTVSPGETLFINLGLHPDTMGELLVGSTLLDERTIPFTGEYEFPDTWTFAQEEPDFSGLLTSAVYRDNTTGTLTFDYSVSSSKGFAEGGKEGYVLTLSGFAGFNTDVFAGIEPTAGPQVGRAADGDQLFVGLPGFFNSGHGVRMIVKTDAVNFTGDADAVYTATDEFNFFVPAIVNGEPTGDIIQDREIVAATVTRDVFAPTGVPIPLPAAAWTGLATLAGAGALWRRWRNTCA